MFRGKEIHKLMLIATLLCVLIIFAVSIFLIMSSRSHLKSITEKMTVAMAEQIGDHLNKSFETLFHFVKTTNAIAMGAGLAEPEIDRDRINTFLIEGIRGAYDADFVALYESGKLVASTVKEGRAVIEFEDDVFADDDAIIIKELGGEEGTFFVFSKETGIVNQLCVYAINNTGQLKTITAAYEDDRLSMIILQVSVSLAIFFAALVFSLIIIRGSIRKYISHPIEKINGMARAIASHEEIREVEVDEKSIFANLERLLNSGHIIFAKSDNAKKDAIPVKSSVKTEGSNEIRKVSVFWALFSFTLCLLGISALLASSLVMTNRKTDQIKDDISKEMLGYYSNAYDSVNKFVITAAAVNIGKEFWDEDIDMDREAAIQRMFDLIRYAFDAEAVVFISEGEVAFKSIKADAFVDDYPVTIGASIEIMQDRFNDNDVIIGMNQRTDFPGYGDDQFVYYTIDVTRQADALRELYEEGKGSIFLVQALICFILLVITLILVPVSIAWVMRRYITQPIVELDSMCQAIMEGTYEGEVDVDENSSFADIQRLLKGGQDILNQMGTVE